MSEFQFLDDGTTEAQNRLGVSFLFAQSQPGKATTGVLNGLAVTQNTTAGPAVLVAPGACVSQDTVTAGVAELVNDTTKTLDVLTANPMGATPRNDLVCFDPATKSVRLIVGTPNASPSDPTLPTGAVPLARIRNAGSATTVPTSAIDDLRTFTGLFGVPTSLPFAQAAGQVPGFSAGSHAAGGVVTSAATFPVGRFTQPPRVQVTISTAPGGSGYLVARAISITATGFTIAIYNVGSTSASYSSVNVDWQAVQMTSSNASG